LEPSEGEEKGAAKGIGFDRLADKRSFKKENGLKYPEKSGWALEMCKKGEHLV